MTRFLDSLVQDLRYALTSLRSAPGFAAVTLLSLGLGIGANTALFTLLDAVMLKGLALGAAVALASGRLVASLLFELRGGDIGTLLVASVALALVATSASLWPASRAARIDVVESLRAE